MNTSIVNVLTPNGRRQNVKVQPNTTILKILEEVCQKHKFDSNEYDLKHHKRIIDLTTMFRFAGLPNNAQLEMVEAQKKRQDADVELLVQLGNGRRLEGQFKPSTTIHDVVQELCPEECGASDLVAIYMRTEILGDKLSQTSLKDLGLVGGRAILRLVHRDPDAAKIQSSVTLKLPSKSTAEEEDQEQAIVEKTENILTKPEVPLPLASSSILKSLRDEAGNKSSIGETEYSSDQLKEVKMDVDEDGNEKLLIRKTTNDSTSDCNLVASPSVVAMEDEDEDDGDTYVLGERNAILFSLESVKAVNCNDLPDSFFDLNVSDIRLLIKELRAQVEGTKDQPLLTAKLRELEEEKEQMNKLNRYKKAIIRIQFPNRYVLQGTFTPYETIETVMDFVRPYLASAITEFYLYTTPPKNILAKEERLFEVHCVPSAVLHFGSSEKIADYLNADVMKKVSSPRAALKLALTDRGLKETIERPQDASSSTKANPTTSGAQAVTRKPPMGPSASNSSSSSGDAKMPKWFKSLGK